MAFPPLPLPSPGQVNWAEPLNTSLTQLNDELSQLDDLSDSLPGMVTDAETARDQAEAAAAAAQAVGTTNDTVTSGLVSNTASATRVALNGLYLTYRLWNGTAYPTRVAGTVNIFLGPTDPGLAMGSGDYWANPAVTTLDSVTAAILDTSTPAYSAVQTVTNGNSVTIPVHTRSGETVPYQSVGISGSGLYGWQLDESTDEGLSGDIRIPYGWNTARARIIFVTSAAGSGDVRFGRSAVIYRDGGSVVPIAETFHTVAANAVGIVKSFQHIGDITLTAYDHVNINIRRIGTSAADTLPVPIYVLGVRLDKVS